MKIETSKLKAIIAKAKKVAPRNSALPILERVLIKDGKLTITNLELTLVQDFPIKGELIVNLKGFEAQVRIIKTKEVEVTIKNSALNFNWGKTKTTIFGYDKEDINDYPSTSKLQKKIYEVSDSDAEFFSRAAKYVSKDVMRPAMCGVYFDGKHVVATDAHKLFFKKIGDKSKFDAIINVDAIKDGKSFSLHTTKDGFAVVKEDGVYIFRRVDAVYPNWKAVLPKAKINFTFSKAELVDAIEIAKATAHTNTSLVKFLNKGNEMIISSEDLDRGVSSELRVDVKARKKAATPFGLSAEKLLYILKDLGGDTVKISNSGVDDVEPNRAFIFNDEVLLMPVIIQD